MSSTPANKSPEAPPAEERRVVRERTFLPARISFGEGGALSTQCTVTQLSTAGARLNVPVSVAMPDRFELAIPPRGLICRARLVWRRDDQAGIEFEEKEDEGVAPEELQARVRELEAINTKLRARVAELTAQVNRLTET